MSVPVIGRNARLIYNSVAIAYGKNISVKLTAEAVKDYSIDAAAPAVLGSGKQAFTGSIDRLFVDEAYVTLLLAGTTMTIMFSPVGTPIGANFITLTGCVITSVEHTSGETGAVLEKITFEAKGASIS